MCSPESASAEATVDSDNDIFRKYYTENDYLLSTEGILKILSAIICIVSSVLFLLGSTCAVAPGLGPGAAGGALVGGLIMALLYVGVLVNLPLRGAQTWLFTDIILSGVIGVLLLVTGALSFTICDKSSPVDYVPGPLAIMNAGMVTASTVKTYVSVMGWDSGLTQQTEDLQEHEV